MKKILVSGSNGLLGQKLTDLLRNRDDIQLIASSRGADRYPEKDGYQYEDLDVSDALRLRELFEKHRPDALINTAAMTNVDECEDKPEEATILNAGVVKIMAALCAEFNTRLVHISTDFIFDGAHGPYSEEAEPNPLSHYGQTKLEAEQILQTSECPWTILRTIIVYGVVKDMSRSNIVLWAKSALEKGSPIRVVNDQWRSPTLAEDLAQACLLAIQKEASGIYHISGPDLLSILEIVEEVADFWGLNKSLIQPISAETLNQKARRPVRTGFHLDKAMRELGYAPRNFRAGLAVVKAQLEAAAS